jgi:hypothetical protein
MHIKNGLETTNSNTGIQKMVPYQLFSPSESSMTSSTLEVPVEPMPSSNQTKHKKMHIHQAK